MPVLKPITVKEDNQSAIQMALSPGVKERSKHTDNHFPNVKQSISDGFIVPEYCESNLNVADVLTKVHGPTKHVANCEMLGLKV